SAQPGFFTRAELTEAYAKASGRDVDAIDFYQVLALTKLAVISEGIYKRFQLGKTVGPGFEDVRRATEPLARRALEIASASPSARLRGR
ncbi:MAG TPA: phosphotransferase family protein, partial [Myxococcota bacterium]|nr:phosphotransferase family protein [Myxococcota bacterium]